MQNSKRRRKNELRPITYDELLSSSSMSGLISFLEFRPGHDSAQSESWPGQEAPHETDSATSGALKLTAPKFGAPDLAGSAGSARERIIPFPGLVPPEPAISRPPSNLAGNIGAPNSGAPMFDSPVPDASNSQAVETGFFTLDSPQIVYRPRQDVREAHQAQDGHTHGEQRLYEVLWRLSRPVDNHMRALTIGERTLATQVKMSYSAVQDNARSLANKLAIEIRPAASKNAPKTYIIYSYEEILKRRRATGLTHYLKRTSAVELVDPRKSGVPSFGAPELCTTSNLASSGAPSFGAPNSSIRNTKTNTESFPHEILAALRKTALKADDDAALRIFAECRKVAPDVTAVEIAEFIIIEGGALARNKNVQNPIGLLIRQIPRCCGETLKQFRAEKEKRQAQERERLRHQREESHRIASDVLKDPSATQEDRAWARDILADKVE